MLVDVEVADFVDAARTMYSDVADPLLAAAERLVDRLGDTAAMAGSDPAGTSWASSYDRAARAAVAAEQNAINGCYRLSAMFAQSARNYENADTCSDARARHSMATETAALPDDTQVSLGSSLPASAGGSGVDAVRVVADRADHLARVARRAPGPLARRRCGVDGVGRGDRRP